MERLRAGDKSLENERLRKQLHDLDEEIKKSRTNFLTQESLLADMNSELQALLEERRVLQYGFEVEEGTSKDDYLRRSEESLLEQSRRHANEATTSKEPVRDQKNFESHAEYRVQGSPPDTSALKSDTSEVKQLREQLEKEIRMNESLHKDLEASRRMLLGRESELAEMKTKFAEMQMRLTQAESDVAGTSSDLAIERARCDRLALEQHETATLYNQMQESLQLLMVEKEDVEHDYKFAKQTILTLNAKLEAQGADLITTKRALRERIHLRTEL
ncbi:hypothetical protein WR25_26779 isoform B [Diploscapter pachys]|uniref:Uncharacterized protein n=1 Tax=Diploscapter pachys TaxID=2018661 RepID=A0A2A2KST4_9BILA|nr:hypothetical protein WR25_26779 isoform B [Diploscapter pachys]